MEDLYTFNAVLCMLTSTHHVTFMHLRVNDQMDDEPGGVSQDEGGDEVPVDDVSETSNTPERRIQENKLNSWDLYNIRFKKRLLHEGKNSRENIQNQNLTN